MKLQLNLAHRAGRTLPALAVALLAMPAMAQAPGGVPPVFEPAAPPAQGIREPARPLAGDTTDRIVRQVEAKYGAKLMKNPKEREIKGRKVLVLTLLDDRKGRVFEVRVDVETGKEL
ncbi:MAG TPA: hypothetical protein VNQ32_02340 [Steroidobacteraceae bacterium]|nr:hypothetical protein [Steroidobacteraceae bacterium]